jgi:hypothetical protein
MSIKTLDDYKNELVNKTFKWLTVLDVYRRNGKRKCLCKCQCGNVCEKDLTKVISGHTKSCGCLKSSPETGNKISQWYKDHPDKVKEKSDNFSQWCKENPDKTAEWGKKYSNWCKENPEKFKDRNKAISDYYKNNPDKAKERGEKFSEWCSLNSDEVKQWGINRSNWIKEHPEYLQQLSDSLKCWCESHPEEVAERGNKYSEWCKNNPEKVENKNKAVSDYYKNNPDAVQSLSNKLSLYYKNNPDAAKECGKTIKKYCKENRVNSNYSKLLDVLHDDYINDLLSGNLTAGDCIKTKCPNCGEFDVHQLSNVFIWSRGEFKVGSPPLCSKCRNQLSSSSYESELYNFITSLGYSCVRNTREIISPLELDLYIPDKNLAIEFNGDYWHSELHKDKDYHYNKFKLCRERGINLISIFESEWIFNSNVIKNYINDYLNGVENELSFNEDHSIMNNNYPSPKEYMLGEFVENYYNNENYKVYTCGFSKIME